MTRQIATGVLAQVWEAVNPSVLDEACSISEKFDDVEN
jgi:hypothetical protein